MAPCGLFSMKKYSFEELSRFTDGFSEANFIGNTMFGKVYHGKIVKDEKVIYVTVKIWEDREIYRVKPEEKMSRMAEEVYLLQNQELNSHPNLVKLLGYCCEGEQVGVVYNLKSIGTIYGFISQGGVPGCSESFNWIRRIKAAVGLACALDFIHSLKHGSMGYLVRNIGPQHIMLDEDFRPIIFDFGMVSGGLLADKRNIETEKVNGCHGCYDPCFARAGLWREECDIMSYGGVLLSLLTNKICEEEGLSFKNAPFSDLFDWAEDALLEKKVKNAFGRNKCLLVHESLQKDQGFSRSDGYYMTELMMCCTNECTLFRPSMKEVVKFLLQLGVVRKYADFMGVKDMVRNYRMWDYMRDYVKGSNIFRDQYQRKLAFECKLFTVNQ